MQAIEQQTKKIIIFDDDEDLLTICTYFLEENGWVVYTFNDCKEVVEHVSNILPDLILMDNWIPDEGGIAATHKLKQSEELSNIPVIYFSANSDIEKLSEMAGADGHLAKPFDLDELLSIIDQTISSKAK
jgi:two-component system cell cycle response regulator DivK